MPGNELELKIACIWEELLGVSAIDVDSDFLSLGGRSLTVVRMLAMIEEKLEKHVSLQTFIQNPTIAGIADSITDTATTGPAWKSLIPLQPLGNKPPLIFLYANGRHVLFLRTLIDHLPKDRPFYALQPVGLDGESTPMADFRDIATHYLSELKSIQPHGPYYLLGYCLGCDVGLEMAIQLEKADEDVGLFVSVDTHPPPENRPLADRADQRARSQVQLLRSGKIGAVLIHSLRSLVHRTRHLCKKLSICVRRICRDKYIRTYGSPEQRRKWNLDRVQEAGLTALRRFRPERYSGTLTFLLAQHEMETVEGWRDFVGDIDIVNINAGHHSMFQEPEVKNLAAALTLLAEDADRRAASKVTTQDHNEEYQRLLQSPTIHTQG